MLLLRPPGVYPAQGDTRMLCAALGAAGLPPGARVLDIGTGTGAVALTAARHGAGEVTAVDISLRAVLAARINALVRGLRVRVVRGDLFAAVEGEVFDFILANPPYVAGDRPPSRHGRDRAWAAGPDGRRVLDLICRFAPRHLARGGTLLMVHSALSGVAASLGGLRDAGLKASVVARRMEPFGPVMRAGAAALEARGLIGPGQRHEELVVIRADRTEPCVGVLY
ncbi:methyltransferase [Microtetraspora sp. NBRC 13810]|uniref:HemK2/MTQ2 family protein methyltransferase n=1 Tax=Microtetraspora sp. NBRC 13810 TaxID=3030990 RepID=UPI0024A41F6D|nr:HemK2/MTQ2 family protein methyltransferase [Microtetraspora sp. NBRC 13810]GLW11432.1 methyltransferase [Microtetraspora sp. NBRC 13810]